MKTRLSLTFLLSFVFYLLSSQVPQGFSYQAAARDGAGDAIKNVSLPVRITIQTTPTGGTVMWQETRTALTDPYGVMAFVVGGPGGTRTDGLANFSDINWGAQTLYIKTEIKFPLTNPDYTDLGTTQIWSVPFSLTTKDVQGTLGKLGIKGATASLDEPLFEVKNNNNQTIFAVYNEGVQVFVDDGAKGKGGFTVGGFGDAKAVSQPYLQVARDYTRVFSNNNAAKGVKGGFAVGGFDAKADPNYYMNLTPENYFIGESSGSVINLGQYNSTLGYMAGRDLTDGGGNVLIGYQAGLRNNIGGNNVMIGYSSGAANLNGQNNIFLGTSSGISNTGGVQSWMGSDNIFLGTNAGANNTEGGSNIFMGTAAGFTNTTGNLNIYIGPRAGYTATGYRNLFLGNSAGETASSGNDNIFIGNQTGQYTTTGYGNVFLGSVSGWYNDDGYNNVYVGDHSAGSIVDGYQNVFVGTRAGAYSTAGGRNTFIGYMAGSSNDAVGGIYIGNEAGALEETGNKLYIDNTSNGPDDALIYGDFEFNLLKLNAKVTVKDLLNIKPRASAPSSPVEGDVYYDSSLKKLRVYDGTTWQNCW